MQQQTGYTHVVRKKKREFRQFKESKDMEEGDPNYLLKVKCTVDCNEQLGHMNLYTSSTRSHPWDNFKHLCGNVLNLEPHALLGHLIESSQFNPRSQKDWNSLNSIPCQISKKIKGWSTDFPSQLFFYCQISSKW